ncbi:hypothetical protein FHW12_002934 [Dokdonella fugitiva]|uniref:Uncharacterized protein n=1 Tax=Dokdonella fugitiva TaxID=328517 RepID=A0A839F992_9GAMM|nr:hypothetical protein [Dokdonella fugitiva]MBA8888701.1 hypothetical protein [Dokdonella fugitiva]
MPHRKLVAIENKAECSALFRKWRDNFASLATPIGDHTLWIDALGISAQFWDSHRKGQPIFWNIFSNTPVRFKQNMIVEVNPPRSGINPQNQGVFAQDEDGCRYVLHRGRLYPAGARIASTDFLASATVDICDVSFSDGSSAACALVCPLDLDPKACVEALAQFVGDCANARELAGAQGKELRVPLQRVADMEKLSPELRGNFFIPPQEAKIGRRRHADVSAALKTSLESVGIKHANARMGRYGPDMYTYGMSRDVLFEIKTEYDAASVQQAVGQLLIYEQLAGRKMRKVIAMPSAPAKALMAVLDVLDIEVLAFGSSSKPKFNRAALRQLAGGEKPARAQRR